LDMDSEVSHLRAEEERILASFTRRLLKDHSRLNSLALEPVIVPRMEKLPVIVRPYLVKARQVATAS
jgi:hypothetical protein